MKQEARFYEKQDEYRYFPLGDGRADVFIREFIREEKEVDEDGNETVLFVYNQNEFRINMEEITEDMIKEDPLSWIDFNPIVPVVPMEERISVMEDALLEMAEVIYNG